MKKLAFGPAAQKKLLAAAAKRTLNTNSPIVKQMKVIPLDTYIGTPSRKATKAMGVTDLPKWLMGKIIAPASSRAKDHYKSELKLNPRFKPTIKALKGLKRSDAKVVDTITRGHELAETSVKKPSLGFKAISAHLSPSVVLKEHNMGVTLPKNQSKALEYFKTMRGDSGEAQLFNTIYKNFNYGDSPRLSRHAIKHMSNRIGVVSDGIAKNRNLIK